jgi:hypothetical protein
VGIYNAEGSLSGEVAYFLGKLAGTRHCALCDITHGIIREKSTFIEAKSNLAIPFETLHLDELDETMSEFAKDAACILALSQGKPSLLISTIELESCKGDSAELFGLISFKLNNLSGD